MQIHRDGQIELNYDPASDVLTISWPDINSLSSTELDYSFNKLIETLKYFDIKKLLIDSRFNKVLLQEDEYSELMKRIYQELRTTRLQKTARLGSLDITREPKAEQHAFKLIDQLKPAFDFRNFHNAEAALEWLKAG